MIRISSELKREVEEKAKENNTTLTDYLEYLILSDIGEIKPRKSRIELLREKVKKKK
jgi:hypothetical protein